MTPEQIDALAWDKQQGLLPAIVQDANDHRVLMLGYMDRAALEATLATGRVTVQDFKELDIEDLLGRVKKTAGSRAVPLIMN